MLEVPPEWNEVPELMMEEEAAGSTKWKRDEAAREQKKRRKEDDIRPEKCVHQPTVFWRVHNSEGFYWNEGQQGEDEWQSPEKWQSILQMVFCGRGLEINPVEDGAISSLFTQHQGGRCSVSEEQV